MKKFFIRIWSWIVSHKVIAALVAAAVVITTIGAIVVIGLPKNPDKTPTSDSVTTTTISLPTTTTSSAADAAATTTETGTTTTAPMSSTATTTTVTTDTTGSATTAVTTATARTTTPAPTAAPTAAPTTKAPTTKAPTTTPTAAPTTKPTTAPTSAVPTQCENQPADWAGCGYCDYCVNYADTMTLQEAADFANAYLESLGFVIDYTMGVDEDGTVNLDKDGDGYYDGGFDFPFTWNKGWSFEECKSAIIIKVNATINNHELYPGDGTVFHAVAEYEPPHANPHVQSVTYARLFILRG